ncbi:PQQ-dependent sugar dehydrogenase [Urbifossiella limnaea]|uniref:Soluble aldose sugar dehydrogenase YliI n=1 Tax=Urbifossiella limnaea TaxID=2528023 RepID=A0A517XZJ0_9BACT|nr:PQQ-dependent sugar dehydrogenase [Urbifossiella limnaea]QDU22926.1 Soluble aldose sugar dehydrogenase YliI precursor [Urbifossiella limnaea]
MTRPLLLAALLLGPAAPALAQQPRPIAEGMKNPESVVVLPDGKTFVTEIGEFGKDGDGKVSQVVNGKVTPFVGGLDDPKGIAFFAKWLFVTDNTRVLRIDVASKKLDIFAPANAFPVQPQFLNDIVVDPESGMVYVSDSGDRKGGGGAVYRITPQGLVSTVVNTDTLKGLNIPNGLAMDGASNLILADFGAGNLYRVKLSTGASEKIADGIDGADGLAWDYFGRLFVSSWKAGTVHVIPKPGDAPVLLAKGFDSAADVCMSADRKEILVPDMKAGKLLALKAEVPGAPVDESPAPAAFQPAFPDLKFTGWEPVSDTGKANQLRLILLTHAGDGSNRLFVPTQQGVIHVFPNDPAAAKQTKVFLDITDRVKYADNTNEEGFLGLAFPPNYKQSGEFFVFYTPKGGKMRNIVSRFRVSKDDPNRADPASEEILLTFEKPFWNHDGGTICFGPDGMLYVFHGDGGAGNDLHDNAQNLKSVLGKILRIDITKKDAGLPYAIPADNPFVGKADARGEVWAYGLRNVWRMGFDRKTGELWAADVGQNLYEEINIIKKGGNYGWNRREAFHPFGGRGVGNNKDMIDPVWEYHHDIGKSITGGTVYRGTKAPELDGHYLYADYVSGRVWALKYDGGRVVANRPVKWTGAPVYSFGEDERGEQYLLTATTNGRGIFVLSK